MNYKEYDKISLGYSDIAALVMVGYKPRIGAVPQMLNFGEDSHYSAYLVDGEAEIGSHYTLIAEYYTWLKIYDDDDLVARFDGTTIRVYRAGEMGCIIQVVK